MEREYIFGSGQLYVSPEASLTPLRVATLQDVSIEFSGDMKELHGQMGFPVAVGRGKEKVSIKAGNGDFDVDLYNATFFGDTAAATGSYKQAIDESGTPEAAAGPTSSTALVQTAGIATATFAAPHTFTVGEDLTVTGAVAAGFNVAGVPILSVPSPTTLTYAVPSATVSPAGTQGAFSTAAAKLFVANAAKFYRDLGVVLASDGTQLRQVSGAPAAMEYSVTAAGLYTFNVAQEAAEMVINYIYQDATSGKILTMKNHLIGTQPIFQLNLMETFEGNFFMVQFNKVICSKLQQPLKLDDFSIGDLEMGAFVDSTGTLGIISTSAG